MPSRLVWRRSSTAIGIYASTALSILGSLVAANILGPSDFGLLALAIATTALLQVLMAVRLAVIAIAAPHGVTATVGGLLATQAATTLAIGIVGLAAISRFSRATAEPLGPERREVVRFVLQSSVGTGIVWLRSWIAPLLLGVVTGVRAVLASTVAAVWTVLVLRLTKTALSHIRAQRPTEVTAA